MSDQEPVIDPTRQFYVSCWNGQLSPQFNAVALLGPFETHREALDLVQTGRRLAEKVDYKAWIYAYGTCSSPRDLPPLPTVFRARGDGKYDVLGEEGSVVGEVSP